MKQSRAWPPPLDRTLKAHLEEIIEWGLQCFHEASNVRQVDLRSRLIRVRASACEPAKHGRGAISEVLSSSRETQIGAAKVYVVRGGRVQSTRTSKQRLLRACPVRFCSAASLAYYPFKKRRYSACASTSADKALSSSQQQQGPGD